VQNEAKSIIESLNILSARAEGFESEKTALESILAENSVFIILFDAALNVRANTLPVAKERSDLKDFVSYLGENILSRIMTAISDANIEPGNILFEGLHSERGDLSFTLYRAKTETPLFVLQLGTIFTDKSDPPDFEEIWDQTSEHLVDVQRLVTALDGIRRLDPKENDVALRKEISEKRLPELMRLRPKVSDPVLSLCLSIIEKNLHDILAPDSEEMPRTIYSRLTPSELQIAEFIRMGKSTKDIADALDIAAKTVENHRNNLREKLGIRNRGVNLRTYLLQMEKK